MDGEHKFWALIVAMVLVSIIAIVLIIALMPVNSEGQQSITILSPSISIRDAKQPDVPMDFMVELQWINACGWFTRHLQIEQSYEREAGSYYWGNIYKLHYGIKWGEVFFNDYRRDDRGLHNISFGYLTDKIPQIKAGAVLLIDKTHEWFTLATTEFESNGLRIAYSKGKSKTVYDVSLEYNKPLTRKWIIETMFTCKGSYYHDLDFEPARRFKMGFLFRIR